MSRKLMIVLALAGSFAFVAPLGAQTGERRARASLGVMVESTPPDAPHAGVVVRDVAPGSPAAKAGMRQGDLIVKAGTKEVKNYEGLVDALAQHKPGDKLGFQVIRQGKEKTLTVTLGSPQSRPGPEIREFFRQKPSAFLGVEAEPLTPATRSRLGVSAAHGVVVAEVVPDAPAAKAGLERGDVITRIDGKDIADPGQLRQAIYEAGVGKTITIQAIRAKETKKFTAKLEETPGDVIFRFPRPRLPMPEGPFTLDQRMQRLERRVRELEKRLRDLEHKLGQQTTPAPK